MSTQNGSGTWLAKGVYQRTWSALTNGNHGDNMEAPSLPIKTWSIEGTFGAGGTVVIEGGDDGTNFSTLHDVFGASMSYTAAVAAVQSQENPRYIRPNVTAGDGTTSLNVIATAKGIR